MTALPYDLLAVVYDATPPGQAYQSVLHQAQALFAQYGPSTRSVLDLACGTGSAAVALAAAGYQVTGLDLSPEMVRLATKKAARAGVDVAFTVGDMREFSLAGPVDAVLCLGDAINHLLDMEDLHRAFQCIYRALAPGGLLVFDVNTRHGLEEWDGQTLAADAGDFAYIWECSLDPKTGVTTVRASFFLPDPAPPRFRRFQDTFHERGWPLVVLKEVMDQCGLELLGIFGWQTMAAGTEEDRHVTFGARRRSLHQTGPVPVTPGCSR